MYEETRIPRLRAALWTSIGGSPAGSSAGALADASAASSLIVPDGCMDLIVIDALGSADAQGGAGVQGVIDALGSADARGGVDAWLGVDSRLGAASAVVIAGADSTARRFVGSGAPTVGLRFDPGVLPQLLSTSAAELADRVTPLDAVISPGRVLGPGALRPSEPLGPLATMRHTSTLSPLSNLGRAANSGFAAHPELLSNPQVTVAPASHGTAVGMAARTLLHIAEALTAQADLDDRPMAMADHLDVRGGAPAMSVAEVAAEFAYSPRQLRRLSTEWFGYGPKHLSKVLRWQAARDLIDGGRTRTEAAARVGYADAAHLWRDERSLLGRQQSV